MNLHSVFCVLLRRTTGQSLPQLENRRLPLHSEKRTPLTEAVPVKRQTPPIRLFQLPPPPLDAEGRGTVSAEKATAVQSEEPETATSVD